MLDPRTKLTVLDYNGTTFSDQTENAFDFSRDNFTVSLTTSSYLYVGYTKPIQAFYVELATPNTTSNEFTAEYYDGSSWTALEVQDGTKGFTRSGFITFSREGLSSVSINSKSRYYVRLRPSANHTVTAVRGINLVFADDSMISQYFPEVTDDSVLPPGYSSHIMAHVAARDEIIQELRNRGHIKYNSTTGTENVNQWDLLDVFEIKQAAVYKALANIFFSLADNPADKWYSQHTQYADRYQRLMNGLKLSVDTDDDGENDDDEKLVKNRTTRLVY